MQGRLIVKSVQAACIFFGNLKAVKHSGEVRCNILNNFLLVGVSDEIRAVRKR